MEIELGSIYRHFKGNLYLIEGIALCSEDLEEYVVYRDVHDSNKLWIRPKKMFFEEVDHEKYPEIKQKYRFEKIDKNN